MKLKTLINITLILMMVSHSTILRAENKKTKSPKIPDKIKQYKKNNRNQISQLYKGDLENPIKYFEAFLAVHHHDLESYYGLTLAYSMKGNIDKAMENLHLALKHGLDFGRFLAGPRTLTKKLTESEQFKKLLQTQDKELIHGPMIGSLTDHSVSIWLRTWSEIEVKIVISETKEQKHKIWITGKTSKNQDYTTVIKGDGLKADTKYYYQLYIGSKPISPLLSFMTMPLTGKPAKFDLGFAGGAGYTPKNEHMWLLVDKYKFRALFLLGDNVYIDTPEIKETQQYCYYRRQSRSEFRKTTSYSSVSAIWDDHDYYTNDGYGMNNAPDQVWKIPVLETFKNNWANPQYGSKDNPGCYFSQSIGDVDFFFIDGRYYRYGDTMLGKQQKNWLLTGLKNSKATFKVLCSNVPITPGTKKGSKDTWDGYAKEREEIFDFIRQQKVEGFFVIAADRHRSDLWKSERESGYPIYEFQSSKFTNMHTHRILPGSIFGYNEKCSFGRLIFDTTIANPSVRYEIIDIDGKKQYEFTLTKNDLSYKK